MDLVAARPELAGRVLPHLGRHLREDALVQLDDVAPDLLGPDLRVEATPHAADEVLDLARGLDPAEPRPTDHEGELRGTLVGVLLEVGALEHLDDPVAEGERVGERLHPDRELGDAADPERGGLAAQGHDQAVVVQPMQVAVAAHDRHLLRVEIDPLDVGGDRPARRPSHLRAQCRHAVAGLELPGADLRQERREEREVLAADEPDLDVVAPPREALEVLRRLDAGEASTEDEDPMRPRRLGSVDRAHPSGSCHSPPIGIGLYHSDEMQGPIHDVFDEFKHQLPDIDPDETEEWLDSLDQVVEPGGRGRAPGSSSTSCSSARASSRSACRR